MNKKEGNSFKLLEKENRALKNLLNAAQLLSESLEIEDVLEKAMETAEKTLNAETSSIWELDEEKDELFFRMIRGEKAEKIKKKRLKIGQGIAGWVASTKKVALNILKEYTRIQFCPKTVEIFLQVME